MGSYLTTPDKNVYVSDGEGEGFIYATASCQGWRSSQEDAEECIPNFDGDGTLFILCDGHGGAEVAKYTVEHFPDFLKNHPVYKKGQYTEALKQAFIDFDAHLRTDEVFKELARLASEASAAKKKNDEIDSESSENKEEESSVVQAGGSSSGCSTASSSSSCPVPGSSNGTEEDDTDLRVLKEEALLPLESILDKYPIIKALAKQSLSSRPASSPDMKASKDDDQNKAASSGSSATEPSASAGPSTSATTTQVQDLGLEGSKKAAWAEELDKHKDDESGSDSDFECQAESSSVEDSDENVGGDSSSKKTVRRKHKLSNERQERLHDKDSDSDEVEEESVEDEDRREDDEDKREDDEGRNEEIVSVDQANRDEHSSSMDGEDGSDDDNNGDEVNDADDDVEDENDYDDNDDDDDEEEEEDDDDDDDDDDDEEDDDDDDDEDEVDLGDGRARWLLESIMRAEARRGQGSIPKRPPPAAPGNDSGCTIVVALVKNKTLYVASSGDSRCIVLMRQGRHQPMSYDHKPENKTELARITKAGGRVVEGRVNCGLNLSRALGDFTYKDPDLPAEEQMITALPDVMTCDFDPDKIEYIFLACDGIWNSMRNKQVSDFIKSQNPATKQDLVDTCLELFRKCIADETSGDGTGCDNMTCIIAKYAKDGHQFPQRDLKSEKPNIGLKEPDEDKKESKNEKIVSKDEDEAKLSSKRSNSDFEESNLQLLKKRRCLSL